MRGIVRFSLSAYESESKKISIAQTMHSDPASSSVDHHLLCVQAFAVRHALEDDLAPYTDDKLDGFLLENL